MYRLVLTFREFLALELHVGIMDDILRKLEQFSAGYIYIFRFGYQSSLFVEFVPKLATSHSCYDLHKLKVGFAISRKNQ